VCGKFFPERSAEELLKNGFVEPFIDAVRLRMLGFCFGMVDVIEDQEQLVVMGVRPAAELGTSVRQNTQQRNSCSSKNGITRSLSISAELIGTLLVYNFAKPTDE